MNRRLKVCGSSKRTICIAEELFSGNTIQSTRNKKEAALSIETTSIFISKRQFNGSIKMNSLIQKAFHNKWKAFDFAFVVLTSPIIGNTTDRISIILFTSPIQFLIITICSFTSYPIFLHQSIVETYHSYFLIMVDTLRLAHQYFLNYLQSTDSPYFETQTFL